MPSSFAETVGKGSFIHRVLDKKEGVLNRLWRLAGRPLFVSWFVQGFSRSARVIGDDAVNVHFGGITYAGS